MLLLPTPGMSLTNLYPCGALGGGGLYGFGTAVDLLTRLSMSLNLSENALLLACLTIFEPSCLLGSVSPISLSVVKDLLS